MAIFGKQYAPQLKPKTSVVTAGNILKASPDRAARQSRFVFVTCYQRNERTLSNFSLSTLLRRPAGGARKALIKHSMAAVTTRPRYHFAVCENSSPFERFMLEGTSLSSRAPCSETPAPAVPFELEAWRVGGET
ncbi:hypothetical protein EVAR_13618_1 [Eumeta japonica]|uniref:Uncharacterized protein n=1 Tax=Eumeta variegata TaxID=151549 RepID=A0A4C1UTE1_EUMVA|nr:hypothetical protein EVAR_13618_1 [Eumeta japonica]